MFPGATSRPTTWKVTTMANDDTTIDEATNTDPGEAIDDDPTGEEIEEGKTFDAGYVRKLRDEAAQHRREKVALESEVEELRQYRTNRVLADATAGILNDPTDLTTFGRLDQCRDEAGMIDAGRVAEAAKALRKERPYLGPKHGDGDQGARGKSAGAQSHVAALSDLLRGAAKS
jgi:hypothetical protein